MVPGTKPAYRKWKSPIHPRLQAHLCLQGWQLNPRALVASLWSPYNSFPFSEPSPSLPYCVAKPLTQQLAHDSILVLSLPSHGLPHLRHCLAVTVGLPSGHLSPQHCHCLNFPPSLHSHPSPSSSSVSLLALVCPRAFALESLHVYHVQTAKRGILLVQFCIKCAVPGASLATLIK